MLKVLRDAGVGGKEKNMKTAGCQWELLPEHIKPCEEQ